MLKFRLPLSVLRWWRFGRRKKRATPDPAAPAIGRLNAIYTREMMTPLGRRGLVGASLGAMAVLAAQNPAYADTAFTSFSFPGTGYPTSRTMPDRIADILNVKDLGAKGDGSTDDTAAIQAAVNKLGGASTGCVFFPPCSANYKVSASATGPAIVVDPSVITSYIFLGSGLASLIQGSFNDFIFSDRVYNNGGAVSSTTISFTNPDASTGTFTGSITSAGVVTLTTVLTGTLKLGAELSGTGVSSGSPPFVETLLTGSQGANSSTYQAYSYYASAGTKSYENLHISNSGASGGAIRIASAVGAGVRNCSFGANFGVICTGNSHNIVPASFSVTVQNCKFACGQVFPNINSTALFLTQNSTSIDSDISNGFDCGIRLAGTACSVFGGRAEICTTGLSLGTLMDGSKWSISGILIAGMSFESNFTAIDCNSAGNGQITGCPITAGFPGSYPYAAPNFIAVAGGTTFTRTPGGGTFVGSISSSGALVVTSGTSPSLGDTLSWAGQTAAGTYVQSGSGVNFQCTGASAYGIRQRGSNTSQMLFAGITVGGSPTVASISVNDSGVTSANKTFVTYQSCNVGANAGLGTTWQMPLSAGDATFINCNTTPEFLFANLPSGAGNVFEGDEYSISDDNSAHTFLATASGGGSGAAAHRKVRWNASSTVWQVVG